MESQSGGKIWHINSGVQGLDLSSLPRCQAMAETTGERCKRTALKNTDRCGIHSGKYRPGAPLGNQNNFRHGRYGGQLHKSLDDSNTLVRRMVRLIETLAENNI
jgi:hypothetical protein